MEDAFDPYHKWLGIAPENRPPTHYQLLGIPEFESDMDVIESAAYRQMAHVRTFQTGKHSAASQRILSELARAKICLLNPTTKTSYDTELKQRLAKHEVTEPPTAKPPVRPAAPSSAPAPPPPPADKGQNALGDLFAHPSTGTQATTVSRKRTRQRKHSGGWLLFVSVLLALGIIGMLATLAMQPRTGQLTVDLGTATLEDVEIRFDGTEFTGKSKVVELRPGSHEILVVRRGYEEFRSIVEIEAGEQTGLQVRLIPLATVTITIPATSLSDLSLTFDGQRQTVSSSGQVSIHCKQGMHTICAERNEAEFQKDVFVTAGQQVTIPVLLLKDDLLVGSWTGRVRLNDQAVKKRTDRDAKNPLQKLVVQQLIQAIRNGTLEATFSADGTFTSSISLGPFSSNQGGKWELNGRTGTVASLRLTQNNGQQDSHQIEVIDENSFTISLPGESKGLGVFLCNRRTRSR